MPIAIMLGAVTASAQNSEPKFSFEFGLGSNTPAGGNTATYQSTNLGAQAGLGYNFNSRIGAQVEYDFNRFVIPDSIVSSLCSACSDGSVILQSVSFDPYVNLLLEGRVGIYLIGGAGFYWKNTSFSAPTGQEVCYTFSGCVLTESTVSSWSTSAFGANGGGGVTVRLGSTRMKVFAEGRYVWVRKGSNTTAAYPPANYGVNYFTTEVGIRF